MALSAAETDILLAGYDTFEARYEAEKDAIETAAAVYDYHSNIVWDEVERYAENKAAEDADIFGDTSEDPFIRNSNVTSETVLPSSVSAILLPNSSVLLHNVLLAKERRDSVLSGTMALKKPDVPTVSIKQVEEFPVDASFFQVHGKVVELDSPTESNKPTVRELPYGHFHTTQAVLQDKSGARMTVEAVSKDKNFVETVSKQCSKGNTILLYRPVVASCR
ncbi:hypothetical protein KFL_004420090 [Klebsormidium nitens]|uniref:Uncharacterized protein n=1 Tax=Klebsormidium nitens TaxID=105231 RepID=A0A1Y1ICA8_KLENI|nr:hypothetical protein KFL_004420090 [Klebsormidium nitens]|eukprot:GAQ88595.1 hypothetical protein KFL_004420090 [Klebsormidium nitens]